jgi:hypothetical protein
MPRASASGDTPRGIDRVIVGWVQPTDLTPLAVGCTHPTNGSLVPARRLKPDLRIIVFATPRGAARQAMSERTMAGKTVDWLMRWAAQAHASLQLPRLGPNLRAVVRFIPTAPVKATVVIVIKAEPY